MESQSRRVWKRWSSGLVAALVLGYPVAASAFCGFYVSGADASLYASATMVVLMREGTTTVLSMQNNYEGPPESFAMVVPVPVVLQKENVKTLPREIFQRVDQLAAPRLVEYWEQDPCFQPQWKEYARSRHAPPSAAPKMKSGEASLGVTIEAQFEVAEYDIVILSARDSGGLDTWLRQEKYNIPKGAEAVLRPYVQQGTKFFVAKVDVKRVSFQDGRAVLSPLRFHYDSDEFSLPVRLGLLNSAGQQDLLVHILARGQRYEVANYPNATIPTNLVVKDETRRSYGEFYDLLYRRTVAHHPGAVVTEYAWDAGTCDPCPVPALMPAELATLGADVLRGGSGPSGGAPDPRSRWRGASGYVLTRLHYRYGPEGLGQDLVFRAAPPIAGGRGMPDEKGRMREERAEPSGGNNFQGRYIILHWWEGATTCEQPMRGQWGGPPGKPMPVWGAPNPLLQSGPPAATAPKGSGAPKLRAIGPLLAVDVADVGLKAGQAESPHPKDPGPAGKSAKSAESSTAAPNPSATRPAVQHGGCASCAIAVGTGPSLPWLGLGAIVGLGLAVQRRPRSRRRR